jgi:DNA-3-methyladenine glycosylase
MITRGALSGAVLEVAAGLLGATLVHDTEAGRVAVRLTEVEAYHGALDPGSHAFRGRTPRTEVMFGPAGHLYVYFSYGMHWCANVVCGPDGEAAAVLLRAGEVAAGVDLARARRLACRRDVDLARGPARLATALALDGAANGADLCARAATIWLEPAATAVPDGRLRCGPRVGVSGPGGDPAAFPWRFWLAGEPTVSGYRPGKPRGGRVSSGGTLGP